jgi:hypothetical protein
MEVFGYPGFADWQRELERQGRFDKQASNEEVDSAISAVVAAVSAGLVRPALNALDHGRLDAVTAIAAAVKQFPPSPRGPDSAKDLLDRMEDLFNARCAEMEKDLRDNLRTNRQSPRGFYEANFEQSNRSARFYDNKVRPVMQSPIELCQSDSDRLVRVNTACADVLVLLAPGWEWSGRMALAEQQLQAALTPVLGTITELRVRRELERVTPLADEERRLAAAARAGGWSASFNQPVVAEPPPRPPATRKKKKWHWHVPFSAVAVVIYLARAVIIGINSNSNSNSTSNNSEPAITPFPTVISPSSNRKTDPIPAISNRPDSAPARKIPPLGDNFREP